MHTNLTEQQSDFAVFLPAISGFFATFIGKQEEKIYKEFLENLNNSVGSKQKIIISETTPLKENAVIPVGPRSHG